MSSHVDAINNNKSMYGVFPVICHYFARLIFSTPPPPPHPLNLMASLVALVDSIINFVIRLLQTHLLICLDNQSPLTNVFKLFTAVYRLHQFIMVL